MNKALSKRFFALICAVSSFFACGAFLRYILIDDTSSYTRIMMHQLYNSPQNIDIAFVGSSHTYQTWVPSICDAGFGKYTFNAGSSSQGLDGSLAIIQELNKYHKVKQIFLELYFGIADLEEYNERPKMVATYLLSDYMHPSLRKYDFVINASSKNHYANSFIIARRNWQKLFSPRYIINLVRKKLTPEYKNYQWIKSSSGTAYYVDRGFVADDISVSKNTIWNKKAYGPIEKAIKITSNNDWYKSLMCIINICKQKNIKLTFVIVPEPEWTIVGKGNYQEYHDLVQNIADKNEIDFFDFNFCNIQYFDARDYHLFRDEDHLNTRGAEKFSHLFSSFFTGNIPKDELFHKTFKEKLLAENPTVYGLAGLIIDEKTGVRKGYAIANRNNGIEYKIELTMNNGQTKILKDFSEDSHFELLKNDHGTLHLFWRLKSFPKIIHQISGKY